MIGNLNALDTQAKDNLVAAVNEVKNTADGKQDIISDLETIRTGAAKGATALQSVPNTYRTAAAQDIIDNSKQDKLIAGDNITIAADGKTISATGGGSSLTNDDVINALYETGFINPATDSSGKILLVTDNNILTL